ncbi:transcriptional regulator [Brevibacterium sediminis]|nr:transcriptional regulator [Brevibacterium sediminis]
MASGSSDHERDERRVFDEVIHSPIRLQVCAVLAASADPVRFSEVQTALGITDSHLSKNVRVLLDAGYVDQSSRSAQAGARSRSVTMLALTGEGRAAYRGHAAWLEHLTRAPAQS